MGRASSGWAGKTTGSSIRRSPSRIRPSRGSATFASRCSVATTYPPRLEPRAARGSSERSHAIGRSRWFASIITSPTTSTRPGDVLAVEDLLRAVVGREEQLREPVGLDPVVLLRHRVVVAAQPGLDVRQRDAGLDSCPRAAERRVRVAVDEHPVGPLLGDRSEQARA